MTLSDHASIQTTPAYRPRSHADQTPIQVSISQIAFTCWESNIGNQTNIPIDIVKKANLVQGERADQWEQVDFEDKYFSYQ